MTFIWGNWIGWAMLLGWFAVSLLLQQPIESTIGEGYFMAITCATTDLAYRFFVAKKRILLANVPAKIGGKTNADAHWLTSKFGGTFFSIPIWVGAILVAIGTAVLASVE